MKTCNKCKIEKELEEFGRNKAKKDGRVSLCKRCANVYFKKYYKDNKADLREKHEAYRKANKERIAKYKKQWRIDNKKRVAEYGKQWKEDNKERLAKKRQEYEKERRAADPIYRIVRNMRCRMNHALNGTAKLSSSVELLGCTPDQWRDHLESQFTEGMAWGQHGRWQVDHVIPCAAFDLTKKKHQRYAFHWSNTQPLWTEANLKKSDNYEPKELEKYLQSELPNYE